MGAGSKFDDMVGGTVHSRNRVSPRFCNNFQSKKCKDKKCIRYHACAGCNTPQKPHADCLCLESH